jgi:hypothetical protein
LHPSRSPPFTGELRLWRDVLDVAVTVDICFSEKQCSDAMSSQADVSVTFLVVVFLYCDMRGINDIPGAEVVP